MDTRTLEATATAFETRHSPTKMVEEGARIYDGARLIWVIQNGQRVRPRGWNVARLEWLAEKRREKVEARKAVRGKRSRRAMFGSHLPGLPAAINRWTGEPHEHARAKARRLRQIANRSPA